MKTFTIDLPEEVVNETERCQYEVAARQGVIDRLFEKHKDDPDASVLESKPFIHFMTSLAEAEAEYELAKSYITEEFIPDVLKNHNVNWNLDFRTKKMTVDILCDCEIEGY